MQAFIFQLAAAFLPHNLFLEAADSRNYGFLASGNRGGNKPGEKDKEQRAPVDMRETQALKAEVLVLYRLEDQCSRLVPSGLGCRGKRLFLRRRSVSVFVPLLGMLNLLSEPAPKKQAFLL